MKPHLDREPESWRSLEEIVKELLASWMRKAACSKRGVNPDLFFPELTSGERTDVAVHGGFSYTERRAKAICVSCPVRVECLQLMYRTGDQPGVWGGTLERERRRYRTLPMEERIERMLRDMDEQAERNGFGRRAA